MPLDLVITIHLDQVFIPLLCMGDTPGEELQDAVCTILEDEAHAIMMDGFMSRDILDTPDAAGRTNTIGTMVIQERSPA